MLLKRLIASLLFLSLISFMSCERDSVSSKKSIGIIVLNNSNDQIKSLEVSIKDGDISGSPIEGDKIVILELEEISSNSTSDIQEVLLKDFSNSGEGKLSVSAMLSNGKVISTGLGNYKNYKVHTEFAPSSWQTVEVKLSLKSDHSETILSANIAKYEGGKFIERF